MRVYDIVAEDLSEAPAGMLKQMGRKIGAKALGAVGAKGTAAGLAGAAKSGDEANQLKVALKGYAGETGKNLKQFDASDLSAFLQSKGYPTTAAQGVSGILTPKQIDDIVLKSVQAKKVAKGGTSPTATGAGAGAALGGAGGAGEPGKAQGFMNKLQQKASGQQPTGGAGGGGNAGGGGGTGGNTPGQDAAPANDANGDGKDDTTGKVIPMPVKGAAPSTAAKLPADIQAQIDALTPKEKQALAGALK